MINIKSLLKNKGRLIEPHTNRKRPIKLIKNKNIKKPENMCKINTRNCKKENQKNNNVVVRENRPEIGKYYIKSLYNNKKDNVNVFVCIENIQSMEKVKEKNATKSY